MNILQGISQVEVCKLLILDILQNGRGRGAGQLKDELAALAALYETHALARITGRRPLARSLERRRPVMSIRFGFKQAGLPP
jgi:hypothetical protein